MVFCCPTFPKPLYPLRTCDMHVAKTIDVFAVLSGSSSDFFSEVDILKSHASDSLNKTDIVKSRVEESLDIVGVWFFPHAYNSYFHALLTCMCWLPLYNYYFWNLDSRQLFVFSLGFEQHIFWIPQHNWYFPKPCVRFPCQTFVFEISCWSLISAWKSAESHGESAESPQRVWGETARRHWPGLGFFLAAFLFLFGVPWSSKNTFQATLSGSFPRLRVDWHSLGSPSESLCCVFGAPFSSKNRLENGYFWTILFSKGPHILLCMYTYSIICFLILSYIIRYYQVFPYGALRNPMQPCENWPPATPVGLSTPGLVDFQKLVGHSQTLRPVCLVQSVW